MPVNVNLSAKIKEKIPAEIFSFLLKVGEAAQKAGYGIYLVGGVVRDLLLQRPNLDIDLIVEGDAIKLATILKEATQSEITTHPNFGTAKLRRGDFSVDLATARSETYARPGALPAVNPGTIESDLFRRDFTINAMAIDLNPERYGQLIDLYGGREDLKQKILRMLHDKSFTDDATRIWRCLRYEQRLGFEIEAETLKQLKRDTGMLATVSGDRIRHELELALKEELPENILRRAAELGVLAKVSSSLKGDDWLAERFRQAREMSAPGKAPQSLYLSVMSYRLTSRQTEQVIAYLRLPKTSAQAIRETANLRVRMKPLADDGLAPSRIYSILQGYGVTAITANLLATQSEAAKDNINLYLKKLRYVKTALSGDELIEMGIPAGPRVSQILTKLREAKLDGKVKRRKDEEKLARRLNR